MRVCLVAHQPQCFVPSFCSAASRPMLGCMHIPVFGSSAVLKSSLHQTLWLLFAQRQAFWVCVLRKCMPVQNVPINKLHEMGYVSIGCEPCTRAVLPNQHEREGRWWWEVRPPALFCLAAPCCLTSQTQGQKLLLEWLCPYALGTMCSTIKHTVSDLFAYVACMYICMCCMCLQEL